MVDTRHDEIDGLIFEHHFPRQFDTISRCAVGGIDLGAIQVMLFYTSEQDGRSDANTSAVTASRTIGRNNDHTPHMRHLFGQQTNACRTPTVVVNYNNIHTYACLTTSITC